MDAMRICYWLWWAFLILWLLFAFRRKQTQQRESAGSRLSYAVPTLLAFYLLLASRVPYEWLNRVVVPVKPGMQSLGAALTFGGIAFAVWARFYIGENWSGSVTVKVGHELIRTGPYAWVRHPIYSGLLLATLGTGLVRAEVRGLLAVPILWFGFWLKSRIEERFMLMTFGDTYAKYSRSTGALIPRLH